MKKPTPALRNFDDTLRVLDFIKRYHRVYTYPPTISEISAEVFLSSTSVIRHLDRLVMLGKIERYPNVARGIVLLEFDDTKDEPKK